MATSCQTHQCDRKGTSLWTTFKTHTARLELRTSDKDAAETWAFTKADGQRLEAFEMWRRMTKC